MRSKTQKSIPPEVRAWFGSQIQHIAVRHDLGGPQISRVRRGMYFNELVDEFRTRAMAAREAGELVISAEELELFCKRAARELMAIRQTRADHQTGKLPTDLMRQLPAYKAFKAYLDESPELVMPELMALACERLTSEKEGADPEPLCQPDHPSHPVSPETRAWMELHTLCLACADDAGGPAFGSVPKEDYITGSALRIREKARRAMSIGDLSVPARDLDKICWVAACEAYLLRSLKAAKQAGELTDEDIRRMPIYGPYQTYFEAGPDLVAMALSVAAALGEPLQPPGAQN